jgi:NTP pyrophosphatase (non-canonical NTP hydrolase)
MSKLTDALKTIKERQNDKRAEIFAAINTERISQDAKWGEQNHFPPIWTSILGEEYGELCEAINETIFNNGTDRGGYANMRKEAIQVAAVAVAFLEFLERIKPELADEHGNERKCRVCGCTYFRPCEEGCHWVGPDICSYCLTREGDDMYG